MSLVRIDPATLTPLAGKVVVITGGASGIGRATAEQLNGIGAIVVFGDLNEEAGEALASTSRNLHFVKTNVTDYASVLSLFKKAYSLHSRIDHAISIAGIIELGTIFDTGLDDAAIEKAPSTAVLDVNLTGSFYFTRVAIHYLRKSKEASNGSQQDGSLVLVSSTAGFHNYNGLAGYSASKHGIMGLLRSTKNLFWHTDKIRVNAVQPNSVRSPMTKTLIEMLGNRKMAFSEPEDIARTFLYLLSQPVNGQALYTVGDRAYETEQRWEDLKPQLLGKEPLDELMETCRMLEEISAFTKSIS